MKHLVRAAFACALLAPLPALAQDAAAKNRTDARCAIALQGMSESVPAETKAAVQSIMMYYVGKLMGRNTPEATGALLKTAENELKPAEYQSVAMGCAKEVEDMGKLLQGL